MRFHIYYQISENNTYLIYFNKTAEPKHQLSFSNICTNVLENRPALKKENSIKNKSETLAVQILKTY